MSIESLLLMLLYCDVAPAVIVAVAVFTAI